MGRIMVEPREMNPVEGVMENIYPTHSERLRHRNGEPDLRLLKKLRIALMIWSVSFILTLIWIYNS